MPQHPPVVVQAWPSERRWLLVTLAVSIVLWVVLIGSLRGWIAVIIWPLVLSRAFRLIAWLRGSAVRLGPRQCPDLYQRVHELSRRIGLSTTPDVFVVQRHGALNAFALRFFKRSMIVLSADLCDACGDNTDARDFIIGHELGHHAAQHLAWQGVLLPARLVPFLWTGYSRAREYTCDRYGLAVVRDRHAALRGLAILAAGGRLGATMDLAAFVQQRDDLNRPLAKLGTWLSSYPQLSERIAALDPTLVPAPESASPSPSTVARSRVLRVRLGAVTAALVALLPLALVVGTRPLDFIGDELYSVSMSGLRAGSWWRETFPKETPPDRAADLAASQVRSRGDIAMLIVAVERFNKTQQRLPYDAELREAWRLAFQDAPYPQDTRLEEPYGYTTNGRAYLLTADCDGCSYSSEDGGKWGDWSELKLRDARAAKQSAAVSDR